jgi:hypothetical protein
VTSSGRIFLLNKISLLLTETLKFAFVSLALPLCTCITISLSVAGPASKQGQGSQSTDGKEEEDRWKTAASQVCLCLSDLKSRSANHKQALHFARMAAQLNPG